MAKAKPASRKRSAPAKPTVKRKVKAPTRSKSSPRQAAAPKARAERAKPKTAAAKVAPKGTKTAAKPKLATKPKPAAKPKAVAAKKPVSSVRAKPAARVKAAPRKPEGPKPRATKLPPVGQPLTKRELEQILTVGLGRGVFGEGSLKGRLVLDEGMPHLRVIGRDKRELDFYLQGPDQEVLPAYVDHKVSVSGLIKKTGYYGGTVDVRKYSAKRPDEVVEPVQENKLRFLSPGEVAQVCNAGMGAGMHGYASIRGSLELSGEDFVLVVSNAGTRQQVAFVLEGKVPKSLKKYLGHTVQATGVVEKASGWGGKLAVEVHELRPSEFRGVDRRALEVVEVVGERSSKPVEVKLNHGFSVRLPERAGYSWTVEPTLAKRLSLREVNFELSTNGPHVRELFFTPRNPGTFQVEFFLAKTFSPSNVLRTFQLEVTVKP